MVGDIDASDLRSWRPYAQQACAAIDGLDTESLDRVVELLAAVAHRDGCLFTAGNGGSASMASHLAVDLGRVMRASGKRLRVLCLTDSTPMITATANDFDYSEVFAYQLDSLMGANDGVMLISSMGNSPNVVAAAEHARRHGVPVAALLGGGGGRLRTLVDASVTVESDEYAFIESTHALICHFLPRALTSALSTARTSAC